MEYPSNGCQTLFLNGTIDEEVYIEQPEGFEINSKDTQVCRLKGHGMQEWMHVS